jgi:hypothetical protein
MAYDGGGIKALKPKPIGGRQPDPAEAGQRLLSPEKADEKCST